MIKLLFNIISFIFILAIILVVVIYNYAGTIAKITIERFAPEVIQTSVTVQKIDFSLLSGRIALNGLSIANPAGYGASKAFGLGSVIVNFDPKSILTDKIVINQVLVDKTEVAVEATYKDGQISSNLIDLKKNVDKFLSSDGKETKEPQPQKTEAATEQSSSKQVVIQDLQINNSELTVGVMKKTFTLPLPNIHQTNIGEKGPEMSWKESVAYVFDLISTEAIKETASTVTQALKETALQAINATGTAANSAKEAAGSLLENAGKLGDSVKGLFGN